MSKSKALKKLASSRKFEAEAHPRYPKGHVGPPGKAGQFMPKDQQVAAKQPETPIATPQPAKSKSKQTAAKSTSKSKTTAAAYTERLAHPKGWGKLAEGTDHGRPADNAKERSIAGIEKLLKASDDDLLALALQGRQQKAPSYTKPSPYRWSNGDTPVGIGLNEGYSLADVVHFHINRRSPANVQSKWDEPDKLSNALAAGKIPRANVQFGLEEFRENLRLELDSRANHPPYRQPAPKQKAPPAAPAEPNPGRVRSAGSILDRAAAAPTYKRPSMAQLRKAATTRSKPKP